MSTTFIGALTRTSKSEPWNGLRESEEFDEEPWKEEKGSPRELWLFNKHSHKNKFDERAKSAKVPKKKKARESEIPNKNINSITNFNIWTANSNFGLDKQNLQKLNTQPTKS